MKNRLIVLFATVALLLVGAVPVSAAPGGVPGPPPGHGKSADDVESGDVEVPDGDVERNGPPEWAKAYGKRIKDALGIPFGHLQQCARAAEGDAAGDSDDVEADDEDGVKKALEACPEADEYAFPEGESGAKAFWVYYEEIFVMSEEGLPILGM
jgi:hypothetical protein